MVARQIAKPLKQLSTAAGEVRCADAARYVAKSDGRDKAKSFVHDMFDDPTDFAITRAMITLGHTLGLQVVAEGVEKTEEARQLALMGCNELQGCLFARWLTTDALEQWRERPAVRVLRRTADYDG